MLKYLEKTGELSFDKIFNQRLGTVTPTLYFIFDCITDKPFLVMTCSADVILLWDSIWQVTSHSSEVNGLLPP